MSHMDLRSKMRCRHCGELFHEPKMAAIPGYRYEDTTLSDEIGRAHV